MPIPTQKFGQLNLDMGEVTRRSAAGGCDRACGGSLRYDDRPGKLSVAAGGGFWRDEGAFAFGAGYTSEDGRVRANLSGTTAAANGVSAPVSASR